MIVEIGLGSIGNPIIIRVEMMVFILLPRVEMAFRNLFL
jgi:hypothetical protein